LAENAECICFVSCTGFRFGAPRLPEVFPSGGVAVQLQNGPKSSAQKWPNKMVAGNPIRFGLKKYLMKI